MSDASPPLPQMPPDPENVPVDPDDPVVKSYAAVDRSILVLRAVAAVAALIWVIGLVSAIVLTWDETAPSDDFMGPGFAQAAQEPNRLAQVAAYATNTTGTYLLAAVAAFVAAAYLESRRLDVLLDADDEDDALPTPH
jgi:hypothetical protein